MPDFSTAETAPAGRAEAVCRLLLPAALRMHLSVWRGAAPWLLLVASARGAEEQLPVLECKAVFVDRYTYSSDRTGVIARLAKDGAHVEQNELIVQLRDDVPRAMLLVAEAQASSDAAIQSAQKQWEAAELEYQAALAANAQSRVATSAFPETHVARLKLNAEAGAFELERARHEQHVARLQRDQARAELDTFRILAEAPGLVTEVFKHPGEGVQQGEAILRVVNVDRLRVEGYVSIADAFRARAGLPVEVTFPATTGRPVDAAVRLRGTLGFIDVTAYVLSDRVRVWADLDNQTAQLREGLPVEMKIVLPDAEIQVDEEASPTEVAPTDAP